MNFRKIFLTTLVAAAGCSTAFAQTDVRFSDDFESYDSTAEMLEVWTETQANKFVLNSFAGDDDNAANKWVTQNDPLSAASFRHTLENPITAGSVDQINFHYDIRSSNWTNSRAGASLRSANASSFLMGIGTWNAIVNGVDPGNKWAVRFIAVPGITDSYYALPNSPNRVPGVWTKLEMHLTDSEVGIEVNDVAVDNSFAPTGMPTLPVELVYVSLGATTSQTVDYDNIVVWTGEDTSVSDWDLY